MRVLISSPPPWADSGYGVQAGLTALALAELGHRVAISAYAGVHEERDWHGIAILGTGGKPYGNGVIAGNYRRWNADLLILVCDPWTVDPGQLAGLHVMPWMPVDCEPLSRMEESWLSQARHVAASLRPVALSEHGARMLADGNWDCPVVPHALQPEMYADPEAGRRWRREMKIPDGAFVIGKVAVSTEDDRKALIPTLAAFAELSKTPFGSSKAYLYLHCEAQAAKAPNLALAAIDLGLKGRVAFADEYRRACDLYSASDMAAMYNGLDVLDATSKAEGFGVPVIEALACGTPVIGSRNSAITEKISPEWGWLVSGQPERPRHHQAWWQTPLIGDVARAYVKAMVSARSMRKAAAAEGARWTAAAMRDAWEAALKPAGPETQASG